jgi:hypothetical protein
MRCALVSLLILVASCAPAVGTTTPLATPVGVGSASQATASVLPPSEPSAPVPAPSPVPTATPAQLPHVFVVVMENTGLARALTSKPISSLASRYLLATEYSAVARPSLPNYLAMTSGSTWDVTDNGYYSLPETGIGAQLDGAGIPWRAYTEGLTEAGCHRSPYPYALKHNPFAYYGGRCPASVVPLEALEADLGGDTPRLVWITPGLCHDGHDCALDVAGAWLSSLVDRITASRAWAEDGVLFVVWDEGDGGDANRVPLIVASPRIAGRTVSGAYDHYSLLATLEDLFGLPRLGAAAAARSLVEVLR